MLWPHVQAPPSTGSPNQGSSTASVKAQQDLRAEAGNPAWEVTAASELHTRLVLALETGIRDIAQQFATDDHASSQMALAMGLRTAGAAMRSCSWHTGFYSNAQLIGNLIHMAVQLTLFPRPSSLEAMVQCGSTSVPPQTHFTDSTAQTGVVRIGGGYYLSGTTDGPPTPKSTNKAMRGARDSWDSPRPSSPIFSPRTTPQDNPDPLLPVFPTFTPRPACDSSDETVTLLSRSLSESRPVRAAAEPPSNQRGCRGSTGSTGATFRSNGAVAMERHRSDAALTERVAPAHAAARSSGHDRSSSPVHGVVTHSASASSLPAPSHSSLHNFRPRMGTVSAAVAAGAPPPGAGRRLARPKEREASGGRPVQRVARASDSKATSPVARSKPGMP